MIVKHITLLNLTKIVVKSAGNSQHVTFFSKCCARPGDEKIN